MARKVEEAIPPTICKYWTLFKQLISLEPSLKHISDPDEYRESLLSGSHAPTFVEIYAIGLAFGAHIRVVRGSKIIDICPDNLRMVELVQNSQDGSFSPPIGTGPIPSAFAAIPPIPLMPEPPPDRTEANGIDSSPPVTPAPCLLQLRGMRPALVECLLRSNFADEESLELAPKFSNLSNSSWVANSKTLLLLLIAAWIYFSRVLVSHLEAPAPGKCFL